MGREGWPEVVKWNLFMNRLKEAKELWEELQREVELLGTRELENYPVQAQKCLGRFRGVSFDWMLPMLVDFWRASGGIDEMFVRLPRKEKEVNDEKKEKKDGSKKD